MLGNRVKGQCWTARPSHGDQEEHKCRQTGSNLIFGYNAFTLPCHRSPLQVESEGRLQTSLACREPILAIFACNRCHREGCIGLITISVSRSQKTAALQFEARSNVATVCAANEYVTFVEGYMLFFRHSDIGKLCRPLKRHWGSSRCYQDISN